MAPPIAVVTAACRPISWSVTHIRANGRSGRSQFVAGSCHFFPEILGNAGRPNNDRSDGAMAKKEDKKPAPICEECGGRMAHNATLPKADDRPALTVYRCDHCGATVITPKQ